MNKDYKANFVNNMIWIRKHYGISKKNMAKLLKISIASINEIERGNIPLKLSMKVLFTIQECFGIAPADFIEKQIKKE